jgi:hypothetical protein
MEDLLSQVLEPDRERMRSTMAFSNTTHHAPVQTNRDEHDMTHARFLENRNLLFAYAIIVDDLCFFSSSSSSSIYYYCGCSVLKIHGKSDSRHQVQQILRVYPKFAPLLNSRIPSSLIPIIWNDPVVKQLVSVISYSQVFFII